MKRFLAVLVTGLAVVTAVAVGIVMAVRHVILSLPF